jgi:hypothetical protein
MALVLLSLEKHGEAQTLLEQQVLGVNLYESQRTLEEIEQALVACGLGLQGARDQRLAAD